MRRKRRFLIQFLLLALILGGTLLYLSFRSRVQPIMEELAATQMDSVISTLMNNAIDEEIAAGEINYERMVFFEKDLDGNLTALRTNMSEVNRLKTRVIRRINERLERMQREKIGIPLGSVLLPELLSGRGPEIPVRLLSIETSGADFENQFSQAGINQTLHRILLTANVDCTVLIPGGTATIRVSTQMVVAETILVGAVPQNYVTFDSNHEQGG